MEQRREGSPDLTEPFGLEKALASTNTLLLDFDGPICKIFSSVPAHLVTEKLTSLITSSREGWHVPETLTDDPLDVLRVVGQLEDHAMLERIERDLIQTEIDAARTAAPTPFASLAITTATKAGRTVGIVSNNSVEAIEVYLKRLSLGDHISFVVGRPFGAPDRMKPNPVEIAKALVAQRIPTDRAVLVGDSVTDIEVAHALGTRSIGFANREEKAGKLSAAKPDALIVGPEAMRQLANFYDALA